MVGGGGRGLGRLFCKGWGQKAIKRDTIDKTDRHKSQLIFVLANYQKDASIKLLARIQETFGQFKIWF